MTQSFPFFIGQQTETKNSRPAPPLTKIRDFFCYSLRTRYAQTPQAI